MVALLCAIVGVPGALLGVEIDANLQVWQLKEKIMEKSKEDFVNVAQKNVDLFLAKADGGWMASSGSVVESTLRGVVTAEVKAMMVTTIDLGAIIGAVFKEAPQFGHVHVLVRKGGDMVKLQDSLVWREPKPLCDTFGKAWAYQGKEEIAAAIAGPLADHFNAWARGNYDKQNHAINLVLSGPGTGKSRMLDEMDGILLRAAELSGDQELLGMMKRKKRVYTFYVTFENGTAAKGSLINPQHPEHDVSYRMLYQLTKDRTDWYQFCSTTKGLCGHLPLSIGKVVDILADLEMTDVESMTVVLCVDGMQKLTNNGTKDCDLYAVLASLCSFMNASKAFAVCVCSATVQTPVKEALANSSQRRVFLVPPVIR